MDKIRKTAYNLLRKTEHYTKTDMVYLTKGGFWLTLGQFVASLSALILSIAFANLVPMETYGLYKYVLSVFPILAIFTLSGMGTATTRAVARDYLGTVQQSVRTKISWSVIGAIGALGLALYYFLTQGNFVLASSFCIVAIFLPFFETFGIYDSLLQGKKNFRRSIKFFSVSQLIAMATMLTALLLTDNLILILLAYFLPWTLVRIVFFKLTIQSYQLNNTIDPEAKEYGYHLSVMGVLSTIANYLDRIIVYHFMGAVALAQYAVAVAPVDQMRSLISRGTSILSFPKFAQKNAPELKSSVHKHSQKIFWVAVIVTLLYAAGAYWLFALLFPKYLAVVPYSILYVLTLLPLNYSLANTALSSYGAKRELYIFNTSSAIFQIITVVIGVWLAGIWGLIIARIISKFFDWLVSSLLVKNLV